MYIHAKNDDESYTAQQVMQLFRKDQLMRGVVTNQRDYQKMVSLGVKSSFRLDPKFARKRFELPSDPLEEEELIMKLNCSNVAAFNVLARELSFLVMPNEHVGPMGLNTFGSWNDDDPDGSYSIGDGMPSDNGSEDTGE